VADPKTPDEAIPYEIALVGGNPEPGRLIGRGHPVGDFLEAYDWRVLEERPGALVLDVHLPKQVKNPRGQLFGGFTPTYVDLVALRTVRAGHTRQGPRGWLATINMRIDYFEPVVEEFRIESAILHRRGRTVMVQTRFLDRKGTLLVLALTTLLER
jgi:acyl-coenzyme A thioesterase PaaI-like protein